MTDDAQTASRFPKEFRYMDPKDLIPYEKNPRINDGAVDFVANSVQDFDFNDPIEVNEDMVILSGHTRRKAALKLGLKSVPVLVISGMSEDEQMAYRIAANKTAEASGWDFDLLDQQTDHLLDQDFDMSRYGMDLSYLEDRDMPEEEEAPEEEEPEGGFEGEVPDEDHVVIRKGDIVMLGGHRIMCGDATSAENMMRLMDCQSADICVTSPPYNAGYIGRAEKEREGRKYLHDEDQRSEEEYFEFLCRNMDVLLDNAREIFYNMGVVSGSKHTIVRLLNRYIDNFKDLLYWQKSNPVPSVAKGVISSGTELIMAFGQNGSRAFRKDIGIFYGIIQGTTIGYNPWKEVHRAIFPEYLPKTLIETFTDEGDSVLDCFLGTGTTLIACQDTNRTCYGMELEPLYVQIAIERWIDHIGASADDVMIKRGDRLMSYGELKENGKGR